MRVKVDFIARSAEVTPSRELHTISALFSTTPSIPLTRAYTQTNTDVITKAELNNFK